MENLKFAVRCLTYPQLMALMEALSQYTDNQGEFEECEAESADFVPSEQLAHNRALLAAVEVEHLRRVGVSLEADEQPSQA